MSGYASGQIAPLLPVAIQRRKIVISLFGTRINDNFKYDRYFSMIPNGPSPRPAFTRGFFKVAMEQSPKPETIALAAADAEFGHNACEGARDNARETGLKIVYDKSYPLSDLPRLANGLRNDRSLSSSRISRAIN